jgi:hypothetical protein
LFGFNADADKISGAILKIEDSGGDAINWVRFTIWASKQGNRLEPACNKLLGQEDVFLVTEAFRISKGNYQLVAKDGAKIGLSASAAGRSLDGKLGGTIDATGELQISGDFFFAVRRAKMVSPGVWTTLGEDQDVPEADNLLRQAQ